MKCSPQKKYQDHVPCSFVYKLVCVDDEFTKPKVVFRGENGANLLKQFLKTMSILTKICLWVKKKNSFNKVTLAGFVKHSLMMTMKK